MPTSNTIADLNRLQDENFRLVHARLAGMVFLWPTEDELHKRIIKIDALLALLWQIFRSWCVFGIPKRGFA
jgi:hypothetical protein